MAVEVRVLADGDGLTVVKGADRLDAGALQREGERLLAAAHPGVVRVVSSGPTPDGWELRTEHAGVALSGTPSVSLDALTRVAASVARTLADLHDRGVVHGRLDGTRVLIGPSGCAALCGFGAPAEPTGQEPTAADDVAALGRLVLHALERQSPVPASGALRTVAERACAESATRRPPARRLADDLARVATPREPARVRPWVPPLAVLLVVAVVVATRWPQRSAGSASRAPAPTRVADATTTTSTLPTCVALAGVAVRSSDCPSAVAIYGNVVIVDDRSYVVGHADDLVAVGDWDCHGELTAALLRRSTGEVLVFSRFSVDRALSVRSAQRVHGATELSIAGRAGGCAELGVQSAAGDRTVVDLAGAEA